MIAEAKNRLVQNLSGGLFTFKIINVYGLGFFMCVP